MRNPNWRALGLCATSDPEIFFPEPEASALAAIRVCMRCPVRAECLSWAIENDEWFGVWGGTTEADRHQYRHSGTSLAQALAESATRAESDDASGGRGNLAAAQPGSAA